MLQAVTALRAKLADNCRKCSLMKLGYRKLAQFTYTYLTSVQSATALTARCSKTRSRSARVREECFCLRFHIIYK
jgi:hypothetical protein